MSRIVGGISIAGIIPPQTPCAEITKPRDEQGSNEGQVPDRRNGCAMPRSERFPIPTPKQHVGSTHPNPAHGRDEEGDRKNNEKDVQVDLAGYQTNHCDDLGDQWSIVPFVLCRDDGGMQFLTPTTRLFDCLIADDDTRGISEPDGCARR